MYMVRIIQILQLRFSQSITPIKTINNHQLSRDIENCSNIPNCPSC